VPGREVILHAPTWTTTLRGQALLICTHTMRGVPRRIVWVQAYLCPCTMAASRAEEATVSPVETDRARNPTPHSWL
jgi:hypothetical protein